MKRLRVCLDARLRSGVVGGAEQTVIGLAHGLSQLSDGDEEFFFLVYADDYEWLKPYLRGPCRALLGPAAPKLRPESGLVGSFSSLLRALWHQTSPLLGAGNVTIPKSDGTIERAGVDVMHFTLAQAFTTDIPNLYNPHDLQHLHFPENFTPRQRMVREVSYRKFCDRADLICAMTAWGKDDLSVRYEIPREKIILTPWAPALEAYDHPTPADLAATRRELSLPSDFIFYPAQTYPHKNHLKLLDALALYREKSDRPLHLICTGRMNEFYPTIDRHIRHLSLQDTVTFTGFVNSLQLKCLYSLARLLVFPTKFEGFGLPLIEAFAAGTPAACSNITCLPELAGGAALLFNPEDPQNISETIARLWNDCHLRTELIARGKRRTEAFSWKYTARRLRAAYRQLAGSALDQEDLELWSAGQRDSCAATLVAPTKFE